MSIGIRLNYTGEYSEDGSIVNGFKVIKPMGKDYNYGYLCTAPNCGHECIKTKYMMKKSSTGLCRECSWKLPNTMIHGNARRTNKSSTHESWRGMKERCNNVSHQSYNIYGGIGIKYEPRWEDFSNFLEDMGERPEGLTLDRVDPSGDYCKENCRWADIFTQAQNKRIKGRGISKHQDGKGWTVTLGCNGEKYYLGYYKEYEKALEARKSAELQYYGRLLE